MRLRFLLLLCGTAIALGACSADPPFRDETDGVITVGSRNSAFGTYQSYALNVALDELCVQSDSRPSGSDELEPTESACAVLDHSSDDDVIDQIAQNMDLLGLKRQSLKQLTQADLYMVAGVVSRDFWNLGAAFCIKNAAIDGCISPLTQYDVFAPVGSLVLALVDLKASSEHNLKAVWMASIDQRWASGSALGIAAGGADGQGGASSSGTIDLDPWLAGVDLAFAQSRYLGGKGAQ